MRALPGQSCSLVLLLSACSFVGATGEVGFTRIGVAGDVALASATGGVQPSSYQGLDTSLGLGSELGSPHVRGQLDLGNTVLTGSAFMLSEDGDGTLAKTFGPLSTGTTVRSRLELTEAKVSITHDFDLGLVKVSPGLGLDALDLRVSARESAFGNEGSIDQLLPLPMLFCRAEGDVGLATVVAEVGYLDMPDLGGARFTLLDLEALLEFNLLPTVHLFAGYRMIDLDGYGEADGSSFALDLVVDGWTIGGGIRF
ncbi:MAG: hypothetical protein KDC98_24715 [Planctomycetes bacterium]|nr:hypothetical protein [Planctomycetota bacterium]